MDVQVSSYANSNGFYIKNNRNKYIILNKIMSILDIDVIHPQYKLYSTKHQHVLRNRNTIATYISSGKQVFLFLTTINNEPITLIIERSITNESLYPKIFAVSAHFAKELYSNTLLEGELYKQPGGWYFIIDTLKIYKNRATRYNHKNNIQMIQTIVEKHYNYKIIDNFKVVPKYYMPPNQLDKLDINVKIIGYKFIDNHENIVHFYLNRKVESIYTQLYHLPNPEKVNTLKDRLLDTSVDDVICNIYKGHSVLTLHKTDNYGVFDLYDNREYICMARIPTIEISCEIIEKIIKHNKFKVGVSFDETFKKYSVLSIL